MRLSARLILLCNPASHCSGFSFRPARSAFPTLSQFHRTRMPLEPFHPRQTRDDGPSAAIAPIEASIILVRFRKSYAPKGEANRAAPPVGRT